MVWPFIRFAASVVSPDVKVIVYVSTVVLPVSRVSTTSIDSVSAGIITVSGLLVGIAETVPSATAIDSVNERLIPAILETVPSDIAIDSVSAGIITVSGLLLGTAEIVPSDTAIDSVSAGITLASGFSVSTA